MMAAHAGNLAGVIFLLNHSADPTSTDDLGRTAIGYAQLGGFPEIALVLNEAMRKWGKLET